jgi:hypothetical protein
MRHRLLFAWLLAAMPAVACSTSSPESPKPDASVYPAGNFGAPCALAADCTGGGWCDFPLSGGCGATGSCAAPTPPGVDCQGMPACPCDGGAVLFEGCGTGFPITGLLNCAGAPASLLPPPEDAGDDGDATDASDAGDGDAGASEDADASDAANGDASDAPIDQ